MKSSRREWLKLACGALAGAGRHRTVAQAQQPTFRDADRTPDKIVALVRAFARDDYGCWKRLHDALHPGAA